MATLPGEAVDMPHQMKPGPGPEPIQNIESIAVAAFQKSVKMSFGRGVGYQYGPGIDQVIQLGQIGIEKLFRPFRRGPTVADEIPAFQFDPSEVDVSH